MLDEQKCFLHVVTLIIQDMYRLSITAIIHILFHILEKTLSKTTQVKIKFTLTFLGYRIESSWNSCKFNLSLNV